jgi:hypothetical protein
VDLSSGEVSKKGNIRVQAWTEDQRKDAEQHYNWRCLISVPIGGLIERAGQLDFEAPPNGYKSADDIVMLQTAPRWQPQAERDYLSNSDGRCPNPL